MRSGKHLLTHIFTKLIFAMCLLLHFMPATVKEVALSGANSGAKSTISGLTLEATFGRGILTDVQWLTKTEIAISGTAGIWFYNTRTKQFDDLLASIDPVVALEFDGGNILISTNIKAGNTRQM